ncbi:MAG: hypothetical protein GY926_22775 [bacterium]|nr:hypothetical protein [bacterium]
MASRGLRHASPLVDALAKYAVVSDKLPYASQKTLANDCGVTDRTVRRWLVVLEALGVVTVYRSTPRLRDGVWSRPTNRYLLADQKAGRLVVGAPSCPVRRRHLNKRTLMSSKPSRYESGVGVRQVTPSPPSTWARAGETLGSSPPEAARLINASPAIPKPSGAIAPPEVAKKILAATRAALKQQHPRPRSPKF